MRAALARFEWETLSTPLAGVAEATDGHLVVTSRGGVTALLADSHGQGHSALLAKRAAVCAAKDRLEDEPVELFGRIHRRLIDTPGVSLVQARVSSRTRQLEFTGVGRIHAFLITPP